MEPDSGATLAGLADRTTMDLSDRCVGNSYLLVERIGQGATGTVWRAVDRATGEHVAVKLLREDLMRQPKAVTRFVQERAILLMLRHRHIVRVRDLLTVGESLGLVMELVGSGSLREHLAHVGTMAPAAAAGLLAQVASALAEAHALGVVHRDLKPDNILLDHSAGLTARLTDFGIARVLDAPGLTTPEALIGTPNYMAPELINGGRAAPPVDVYALGVVLYELIVGRQPFAGGSAAAVLRRHLEATPRRYPGIPDAVWLVIEACLEKNPDHRPHAADLVTMLRSLARTVAGVPALAPVSRSVESPTPVPAYPSVFGPRPAAGRPPKQRRNRPGTWRWLRFSTVVLAVAASAALAVDGVRLLGLNRAPESQRPAVQPPSTSGPSAPPSAEAAPTANAAGNGPAARALTADAGASPGPDRVEADVRVYGPWQCLDQYRWDIGHPVLAKPCYAVGVDLRVIGHMQTLPGVQADVSISVEDAETGAAAAGPYTCKGLMFTDFAPEHTCGPFNFALPRGRRYVVVQKWQYTGRGLLPTGIARGPEFRW